MARTVPFDGKRGLRQNLQQKELLEAGSSASFSIKLRFAISRHPFDPCCRRRLIFNLSRFGKGPTCGVDVLVVLIVYCLAQDGCDFTSLSLRFNVAYLLMEVCLL